MGDRYMITGVQIGMILGLANSSEKFAEIRELLQDIIDDNYIGHTRNAVNKDVEVLANVFKGK